MKRIILSILTIALLKSMPINAQTEPTIGLNIGNKAPELSFATPEGANVSLSSLKGKVVLIDFWSSWCSPCRAENPNVVKTFNEYKDKNFKNGKGFTVYGVSLDRSKESWEAAIKADNLTWTQVSDLKYWNSEGAKLYQVRGIPSNFLIDGNGIIIEKNLRGANLREALEKIILKEKTVKDIDNEFDLTIENYKKTLDLILNDYNEKLKIVEPKSEDFNNISKQIKKIEKLKKGF